MIITIFILFLLYMAACIMDGPDMKPLWKKALGAKLEKWADELKPINYCNHLCCKYYLNAQQPQLRCVMLEKNVMVGENELMEAMRNEQMAKHKHLYLPKVHTVDGVLDNAKRQIVRSLLQTAESYIVIDERRNECFNEIYLCGSLYVGNKQRIY